MEIELASLEIEYERICNKMDQRLKEKERLINAINKLRSELMACEREIEEFNVDLTSILHRISKMRK